MSITTVVFDVGNVLIEWDPNHLYRRLIPDDASRTRFLAEVCTPDWNIEQDRGRTWAEGVAERVALFPEHEGLIRAFDEHWMEMVPGEIPGTVAILEELHAAGVPLYAITNFSAEKWALTLERFPFLARFRGVIVSAHERMIKPDRDIFDLCATRFGIEPGRSVFIDDSEKNIVGARAAGFDAIHFSAPSALRTALIERGVPLSRVGEGQR